MLTATLTRDSNPLDEEAALRAHINQALASKPPYGIEQALLYAMAKRWFRTRLYNSERIPDRPCLFIGNHALFGLDGVVILPVLLEELGRFLRPMGDRFLFSDPRIARLLLRRGATMGHPSVARALMEHDQDILVFPGGAHEAVKPSRERYTLQWKERLGFVRLAVEHGYPIVPFGLVGPDEFYEYLLDGEQIVALLDRLGLWRDSLRRDVVPPLLRGSLGTLMPRPQACYMSFGEPVETRSRAGTNRSAKPTERRLRSLRDRVAQRIEGEIEAMLNEREDTRHELGLLRRIATL
ncbi:MAG: lysophospholipid acyltransferase family protein [Halieaceae bacterium]|jgi:1-acyl-sn-glycerol-3-phosphate acyltransferase|nr:lysophospholipid acyltransferase family protein [Halieaceae bacterium]